MANDFLYPDISLQALKMLEVVRKLILEHPAYLIDSPYDASTQRYLRDWFQKPVDTEKGEPTDTRARELVGANGAEALYREAVDLYSSMHNAKPSAGDTSESMAYFRTIVSLMEKMIAHKERAMNIRNIGQFYALITDIMENELSAQQREAIMARINEAVSGQ